MAHLDHILVGHYGSVPEACADYDAVVATHEGGATGHIEVAVVARDVDGEVRLERHARLGGIHLSHGPSNELQAGTQEIERGTVALLVVSSEEDLAAVGAAVTRASASGTHPADHAYRGSATFGMGESGSGSEGRLA